MRELQEVAGQNGDPMRNRQKTGLLTALTSDLNTDGMEVDRLYTQGDGKTRKAILKYMKPDAVSDTSDTITDICEDVGASSAYVYDEVAIDNEVQSAVKTFTDAEMRALCETGSAFRMKVMGGMLNSVAKKINRTLITDFSTGVGGILNGSGAAATNYDLLFDDGGIVQLNPPEWIKMMRDLDNTGLVGNKLFIGGAKFDTVAGLKNIAYCNAYGQDVSATSDPLYYHDIDIDSVLTAPSDSDNSFFVFGAGAAQLIDKPLYKDEFRIVHDQEVFDTIVDPVTGLEYDFELIWDRCDKSWKMKLSLHYGLWQLPLDLYKSGDDRYKVNYNFWFTAGTGS